jgi:serine/threonine-protein kinase
MEYVEGDSLSELIRTSRKIDPKRAITLVKEVASGLSAAHDKGVVHRDIKPDNIMLTKHGGVKVVDFGVARVDDPNTKLTATGMAVGTPNYISPEVCLGLDVDKRSDLFSMGIVLYEMLTGNTPFTADSPLEMMTNVVKAEVPDITSLNPQIDEKLRMILYHMLEKKPDYRYQDFHEVLQDIDAYLAGKPLVHAAKSASQPTMYVTTPVPDAAATTELSAPRPSVTASRTPWAAALILILVAGVAGGWWYLRDDAAPAEETVADETLGIDAPVTEQSLPADDELTTETPDPLVADTGSDDELPIEPSPPPAEEADPASPVDSGGANANVNNEPEPPAAPDYSDPGLVIVVNGDRNVALAFESALESELTDAQFTIINEQFFEGFRSGASLASLGKMAQENGGDVLVAADIRIAGSRTLEFYGRTEEQTIATLQVTAMLPTERRNLGTPWQASLEYTVINAAEQARDAAAPIAKDLIGRLRELQNSE